MRILNNVFVIAFVAMLFSCREPLTGDVIIEDVNIVDVANNKVEEHQDLVIVKSKITKIVPHGSQKLNGRTRIAGANKYLIPGLWDMHVHTLQSNWYQANFPLMRANGITGFRDMYSNSKTIKKVRRQIQNDSLLFFRFVATGHMLDGLRPAWNSMSVAKPEDAKKAVDSLVASGDDFIKVYSHLRPEVFYAVAKRCREKKIPFAGHVPDMVFVTEASNAGLASSEHLLGFLTEACEKKDSVMSLFNLYTIAHESGNEKKKSELMLKIHELILNHFSKEKLRAIAKVLKRNNTYVVPTRVCQRGLYFQNDTALANDPRMNYMPKATLDYWREDQEQVAKKRSPLEWKYYAKRWQIEKEVMKILAEEKVPMMTGTDADVPYVFSGFSLHDEIIMLTEMGMSNAEALCAATLRPAQFLGLSDSLGTVAEEKLADLVMLRSNPLEDIKGINEIESVIGNGKIYDRDFIDSVLESAKKRIDD